MAGQGLLPWNRPAGEAIRAVSRSNGRRRQQGQPDGDIIGRHVSVLEVDAIVIKDTRRPMLR